MDAYHLRRNEKEIRSREDLLAVIKAGEFMTIALCRDSEPYLVSVNYAADQVSQPVQTSPLRW